MFYETLKAVCSERGTSPSAVCVSLGMSRSNVTEWKNGRSPRLDVVIEIAKYLNVDVLRLIPENSDMMKKT